MVTEATIENLFDLVCAISPIVIKNILHIIKRISRLVIAQARKLLITYGDGFTENKYSPNIIISIGNKINAAK